MNDESHHDQFETAGDRMARRLATLGFSLVALALVAAGNTNVSNRSDIAQLRERCEARGREIDQLHERLRELASDLDIDGLRKRVDKIDREAAGRDALIRHLMSNKP